MRNGKAFALVLLLGAAGAAVCAHGEGAPRGEGTPPGEQAKGVQGYAGPGWGVLFDSGGAVEVASLGPVMFRAAEGLFVGPLVAYQESASEGPNTLLGGVKLERYLRGLSRGWYSTSLAVSLLAGATGINQEVGFAAQLDAELDANLLLFPSLTLAAGPMLSLRLESQALKVLPGFGFSLKEGSAGSRKALIDWGTEGPWIGGYWQGLWSYVNGRAVFVDGGGTRLELPSGLAFGITGGVLRQRISQGGSDLAIMHTGVTVEWNAQLTPWLTLTPRLAAGLALYGWVAPDGSIDGGPHLLLRPELCVYVGVLPFLQLGGGIGYQFVPGTPNTSVPLDSLSSPAFSVQVRVGHRRPNAKP